MIEQATIDYKYRHPEQLIAPNFTESKQWEPLNAPGLCPWFVSVSEIETIIRVAENEEKASDFKAMLGPNWNGVMVVKSIAT